MTHLSFLNPRKRLKSKENNQTIDLVTSVPNFQYIYAFFCIGFLFPSLIDLRNFYLQFTI